MSVEAQKQEVALGRSLPHSDDAEKVLLGSPFINIGAVGVILSELDTEDFYNLWHKRIHAAMARLFDQGQPIEPILVFEEMKKENPVEGMSVSTLIDLTHGLPHISDLEPYIKLVRDDSDIRKLIRECSRISETALSREHTVEELFEEAESRMYGIRSQADSMKAVMVHDEYAMCLDSIRERKAAGTSLIGLSSGFSEIDFRLQGYRPGQYIITAARPSIGKTAILLREMYHAVVVSNVPVVFFSVEMSKEEIVKRIASAECDIDSTVLRMRHLTHEQWLHVEEVKARLQEAGHFFILDYPMTTVRLIRTELRRIGSLLRKEDKEIGLVGVDHVGLMKNDEEKRGRSREGEVSEISRGLKQTAREFKVPLHALSQVNRQAEGRSDHRLLLSDLRESGSLEQDADVVRLLYREDYYQRDPTQHTNIAEVTIAKNRNGPTGVAKLYFTRKSARFSDLSQVMNSRESNSEGIIL